VASHVPAIIKQRRPVTLVAPGCYRIGPDWFSTFWVAANELPLVDELVPFLVARTEQALDAFVRWVKTRRPLPWLLRVLESLPMSVATYEDLSNFTIVKTDDPEVRARRRMMLRRVLEVLPEAREELIEEAVSRRRARACVGCSVRAASRSQPTTRRGSTRVMSRTPSSAGSNSPSWQRA
jgi:hypothetical protein